MYMKKIAAILLSGMTFYACSNDKTSDVKDADVSKTVDAHEHTYRCPMHPEVTGKEGDTCPKCGMKLEHSDDAPSTAGTYFMQYASKPEKIEPNKEAFFHHQWE